MAFRQISLSLKKSKLLLLLLAVFFVKQLFMVAVFPIFQGPDEPIHYSRIQQLANPDIQNSKNDEITSESKFSEEILKTSDITEAGRISFDSFETQKFADSRNGEFENEIKNNNWSRIAENKYSRSKILDYYFLNSSIEKIFSGSDILHRFFAVRIFSAILGLLSLFFIFLAAKKIFDEKISFLLSVLVAFQPMFSQTSAIINYDILLVFAFSAFLYGSISALKDGISWKNSLIMILSTALGISAKAPGIVLTAALFALAIYFSKKHFKFKSSIFIAGTVISILLIAIIFLNFLPDSYTNLLSSINQKSHFSSIPKSIFEYVSETKNRWNWSELSYWGNFGWLDARIPSWMINIAHYIEIISLAGIAAYFVFPQKIPEFLPQRKFTVFLIGISLALQFTIRFADWSYYNRNGNIDLGTPGRYFLPVIGAQFSLIIIGIGMLARKYSIWKKLLKVLAISMVLLWTYSVLIVIIPRYYL